MSSHGEIPIQTTPKNHPTKRRHSTHYYAHRVRSSLTTRISKVICSIFLCLLLFLGVIAFILWLTLRPHRPRFHVRSFSFPSLAQDTGFQNAQLSFNVSDRNPNQYIGIYYDAMEGLIYYRDQRFGAKPLMFPSYQPSKNTTWILGEMNGPVNTERWKELMEDRSAGTVVFRLEVKSTIRFKVSVWQSKRHRMHTSCRVAVGQDGLILPTSKDKRCHVYFS